MQGRQICRTGRTGILGFEASKGNDDGQRLKLQMLGLEATGLVGVDGGWRKQVAQETEAQVREAAKEAGMEREGVLCTQDWYWKAEEVGGIGKCAEWDGRQPGRRGRREFGQPGQGDRECRLSGSLNMRGCFQ